MPEVKKVKEAIGLAEQWHSFVGIHVFFWDFMGHEWKVHIWRYILRDTPHFCGYSEFVEQLNSLLTKIAK